MPNAATQESQPPINFLRSVRYLPPRIGIGLAVHLVLPQLATLEHSYQVIKGMLL